MNYNESLSTISNYPPMSQSDWDRAPWNEKIVPDKEIEVTVSVTLSRTVKITVNDYTIDEEGYCDFSECDLHKAVKEQIKLPQQLCKDWTVDEFEIIEE